MAIQQQCIPESNARTMLHFVLARLTQAFMLVVSFLLSSTAIGQVTIVVNSGIAESVFEDAGTHTATVSRSGGTLAPFTVDYQTVDSSAIAGQDYTAVSGQLVFIQGQVEADFSVPITNDSVVESTETLGLMLSNPVGPEGYAAQNGLLNILDDDDGLPEYNEINFTSINLTVDESAGLALLTVTMQSTPQFSEITTAGSTNSGGCGGGCAAVHLPTSVSYTTNDGTAKAGEDYVATSGTLIFGPGESTVNATLQVPIINDNILESLPNETFSVTLSNASGAELGSDNVATVQIVDSSSRPLVEFNLDSTSVTVNEADGTVSLTVNRSGAGNAVSVDFATANGSATAGEDYTAVSGRLNFSSGQTSASIDVPISSDMLLEALPNETFTVALRNPSGGAVLGNNILATVQIVDNSPSLVEFNLDSTDVTVNEGDGSVSLTVNRSPATDTATTVDFAAIDGTATAGEDYIAVTGTVAFAAGQTSASIEVPISNDNLPEAAPNETFTIALSNPTGGAELGSNSIASVQIVDATAPQEFSLEPSDLSVDESSGTVTVTVLRSNATESPATVDFVSTDGTATAGEDYTALGGTLNFSAGQTSASIELTVINDMQEEPGSAENFFISLSNPSGGAVLGANSTVTINITDNDSTPAEAQLNFNQSELSVAENIGAMSLTVSRTGSTNSAITVSYSSSNGTASAGQEYTASNGTLSFSPGQTTASIAVDIIDDNLLEPAPNKTFTVSLNNPTGGVVLGSNSTATIVIVDNDGDTNTPPPSEPQARAENQTIESSNGNEVEVTLDGSASVAPADNPIISYIWRRNGAVEANVATFIATLGPGEYLYSLEVADALGRIATTDITVIVTRSLIQAEESLTALPDLDKDEASVAKTVDDVCTALNTSEMLTDDQEDLRNICSNLIIQGSEAQKVSALKELSAEEITGQQTNAIEIGNVQLRNIAGRLRAIREGARGVSVTGLGFDIDGKRVPSQVLQEMLKGVIGGVAGEEAGGLFDNRLGIFVTGNVSFGDKDETDRETGFDFNTRGISAGFDYRFTDELFAGMAFGYGSGDTNFFGDSGGLETDGYSASAFGSYFKDRFYLDAIASYGLSNHDSERRIQFQDVNRTAQGDTEGEQISVGFEAGLNFERGALSFTPNVSVFHTDLAIDGFQETGANGLNLNFEDQNVKSSTVSAGVQAAYVVNMNWGVLRPQIRADYIREMENETQIINVRFVNDPFAKSPVSPSAPITVTSDKPDKDYLLLGLGVSAQFSNGFSGFVDWQTTTGYKDLKVNSISFGLRWERSF